MEQKFHGFGQRNGRAWMADIGEGDWVEGYDEGKFNDLIEEEKQTDPKRPRRRRRFQEML